LSNAERRRVIDVVAQMRIENARVIDMDNYLAQWQRLVLARDAADGEAAS
jgi:hypothetical protein